nr:uncharacterized protein LOC128695697 [Cherax quadricarinatus]
MQARSHMVVLVAVLTSVSLPRDVVSESEGSPAEGDDVGSEAGTTFPLETTNSTDGDLDSSRPEEANNSILQDDRYIYEVVGPSVTENNMAVTMENISTVLVNGVLHYDIAQATTTRLILGTNDTVARGVTSTSHEPCLVRDLVIEAQYNLHKNISNCKLQSLSIKGGEWWCRKELVWVRNAAEEVNTEEVVCENIWCHGKRNKTYFHYFKCPFLEGLDIVKQFVSFLCLSVDLQVVLQTGIIERVIVHCENANLTDSSLPEFPINTTDLRLDFNKLRSTTKLFERTKNQEKLEVLSLIANKIDTFPVLESSFFPKLEHVYLQGNNIKEMDTDGLLQLLGRKGLNIELSDNPWTCDCKLYQLNVGTHIAKLAHTDTHTHIILLIINVMVIIIIPVVLKVSCSCQNICTNLPPLAQDTIPLRFLSGEVCPETSFALSTDDCLIFLNVVLGLLNILMFYFVVDLVLILVNFQGTRSSQRPKVDIVVCGMKRFYSHAYRRLDDKELQKQEEKEYRNLSYRNCYRESFSVRRRTPRPSMEYGMG